MNAFVALYWQRLLELYAPLQQRSILVDGQRPPVAPAKAGEAASCPLPTAGAVRVPTHREIAV